MKFSVGYQQTESPKFINEIINSRESIHEVYFAWDGFANGRNTVPIQKGITTWEYHKKLEEDLLMLSNNGIKLNLLFNATCYGKDSQSRSFFESIGNAVDYIQSNYSLNSITTTSPLIAKFIKSNFSQLDVRASVNMEIGSVEGLDYVSDYFDSFYLKKELNRNFNAIEKLKKWCDDNGKTLYLLANSCCLNNCSAHVFHNNLVSHESEIAQLDNGYVYENICRKYIKKDKNRICLLNNTNFIRPEDVPLYEKYFSAMKLATRVNSNPERIIRAYIKNKGYSGSILDLMEPNHTALLYPYILENKKIESEIQNGLLVYKNFENALIRLEENIC